MRVVVPIALAFGLATLAGCTVGEDCVDQVETTQVTDLGFVRTARCGIGHCLSFTRLPSKDVFRMHFPMQPGTFSLEEVDAELCSGDDDEDCVPVTGTIVAREVHRPERGRPVGRLDADLRLEHASLPAEARLDYREELVERCSDKRWPDLGGSRVFGP